VAIPSPSKKGTHRRIWGVCLTQDMFAKPEAAVATMPAVKTTVAAYLMDATGATRSSVRTWLCNDRQMRLLGRPAFFTEAEEDTTARAMELWTASGGQLTREMLGRLLRDYVHDWGPCGRRRPRATLVTISCRRRGGSSGFFFAARSYAASRPPGLTRPARELPLPRQWPSTSRP